MIAPSLTNSVLALCIGLSGFSALTYEIVWFRRLANVVGSTVQAASITTAVFLAGLALGAIWFGRYADRAHRPLRIYVWLELFIGACGIAVPLLIGGLERFVAASPERVTATLLLGGAALLLPTVAMGGTLPVLCRALAGVGIGVRVALLYAVNTAGGAVGCLAAGFLLIPFGGEHLAIAAGVFGNLLAAGGVSMVGRTRSAEDVPSGRSEEPVDPAGRLFRWPFVGLSITGFSTLAAQILWLRLFPLYIGNTTYAFVLVLVVFLLGIAVGSAWYRRFLATAEPHRALLWPALLLAAGFLPTLLAADQLAHLAYRLQLVAGSIPWLLQLGRGGLVALLVLVPTFASGLLFPALVQAADPESVSPGKQVGSALFGNTTGAVAGSLAVPLLLIPTFGLQGSFRVVAGLALLLVTLLAVRTRSRSVGLWGGGVLVAAMLLGSPGWDPRLLTSGVYLYAPEISEAGGVEEIFAGRELIAYEEGLETTVAVFRSNDGTRYFSVNGKVDGGSKDMPTQVLLGQLPMLLHPDPRRVMVIGLGTGVTLAEALRFPGSRVDCSEIEPGVVRASDFFAPEHGGVLVHPRAVLRLGDARQHLLTGRAEYDVIISEPSNPWQSGNSRLFTRDFYRLATARLNPGGLFTQWLPIYDLPPEYLQSAVATFLDSFPRAVGFLVGRDDLILVARKGDTPLEIPYSRLRERWNVDGVAARQMPIGNHSPAQFLAQHFLGGAEVLAQVARTAPVNTDAWNRLEFMRQVSRTREGDNLRLLGDALGAVPAEEWVRTLRFDGVAGAADREEVAAAFASEKRWREAAVIREPSPQ